jgi:hypothetical protein
MYFYKFKVTFDEVENFERNIEILPSDNFESFHQLLFDSIGLSGNELASFYICDTKWNKKQEITLVDMQDDREVDNFDDEEEEYSMFSNIPKFIMHEAVLKDFIADPHQHIIYQYDFINPKVFYIELLKTLPAKENAVFPRCTLSEGALPVSTEHLLSTNPEDDFLSEFLDEIDEEDLDDLFTEDQTWDDSQTEFDSF